MGKNIFLALFLVMMMTLSVTAAQAEPGCNNTGANNFYDVMKNHAEAMRVRDRAYGKQIITRSDPAMGMSCFDRAMGVTSRLGSIFSDVRTVSASPFAALIGSGPAAMMNTMSPDNLLIMGLNRAISPVLSSYLSNFNTGTISAVLGSAVSGFLNSVVSSFTPITNGIIANINAITGTLTQVQTYYNQIEALADYLGYALPHLSVAPAIALLNTARNFVNTYISQVVSQAMAVFSQIMNQIVAQIMGPLMNMTCDLMANMWDAVSPIAGLISLEGMGIEEGSPYFTIAGLMSGSPAGIGAALQRELSAGPNGMILSRAYNDLNTLLNQPGNMPAWRRVPAALNAVNSVNDLIGLLDTN